MLTCSTFVSGLCYENRLCSPFCFFTSSSCRCEKSLFVMYEEKPGIDFKLCIICQTEKEEQLVENVKSSFYSNTC